MALLHFIIAVICMPHYVHNVFVHVPVMKRSIVKMNEAIFVQIGTSSQQDKGMK